MILWMRLALSFLCRTDTVVPFSIACKRYVAAPEVAAKYKTVVGNHADLAGANLLFPNAWGVLALRKSVLVMRGGTPSRSKCASHRHSSRRPRRRTN